eukprot:TRINITY_DN4873_c0_g1_i5.p1 TRINITY_DN4873_c0_g1~~TRINITY_DN4873_c0_g1_i5.p1  ORF type:complete len:352 (-),score=70.10 TRINITY_DN4873_c0_g1_i5:666-1721(-)
MAPKPSRKTTEKPIASSPSTKGESVEIQKLREKHAAERANVTLLRSPIRTISLLLSYVVGLVASAIEFLKRYSKTTVFVILVIVSSVVAYHTPGEHQQVVKTIDHWAIFVFYWTGLGILSSVMVGTGLHTFVLFLGPHIGKVTLAATECNTLDFVEVAYDVFQCPSTAVEGAAVTLLQIFRRVQLESFLWGFGTALGELPPYFVARAARLAGGETEEEAELEHVGPKDPLMMRVKAYFYKNIKNFGFFGIMLFASIPNPLFDLAGIACGHFLIPFKTFFGATAIGKAFFKAQLQAIFVIAVFNKSTLESIVDFVGSYVPSLSEPVHTFLHNQMAQYHGNVDHLATKEVILT